MKIAITDHRKIYTVQKEFNELFPYLKIEFYAKPHTSDGASSKKLIHHSSKTLGTCRTRHNKGILNITPHMSVRDLRQTLNDVYGFTIKVSRMSGNSWMDAADSDGWSLEKQNEEGQKSLVTQETV